MAYYQVVSRAASKPPSIPDTCYSVGRRARGRLEAAILLSQFTLSERKVARILAWRAWTCLADTRKRRFWLHIYVLFGHI